MHGLRSLRIRKIWRVHGLRSLRDKEDVESACSKISEVQGRCGECMVEQVEGPGHYDIAVVGDEVMVTECRNKGVVTVYNREVKFKRHIQCTTHDPLSGLCTDSH